jgi:hypothetical protein
MLSVSERVVRYLPKTQAAVSGWWPRFGGSNLERGVGKNSGV